MPFPYARHASDGFNHRLDTQLAGLAAEVRRVLGDNLAALILSGGYGRGEGGVLVVNGEERFYNDLDLLLVVRRKSGLPEAALDAIRHKFAASLGIEVDFSRPLTVEDIRAWPPTLMWSDVLNGHRVIDGPPDILTANAPPMPSDRLPPIEAARLLLNRGAGLLWAFRVLRKAESPPDPDFVRRNYFKCALALGDAMLISHGRFATPYTARDQRLAKLLSDSPPPFSFDLAGLYGRALRFKFWPAEFPAEPGEAQLNLLAREWGEIFLYVEGRRARRTWPGATAYRASADVREPAQNTVRQWPRNFIKNRRFGYWSLRYPRERLYRDLPLLLGLCETVPNWQEHSARFLAIWKQVN